MCTTRFKELVLPLIYSSVQFTRILTLRKFYKKLHDEDQKWDSIRRIPYSTPGRWVQKLDLTQLAFEDQTQSLEVDSILTQLFPLVPFLEIFLIHPSIVLSRRALASLGERDGASMLRHIGGLSYLAPPTPIPQDDPFVKLLRRCPNLESLDIIGQGLEPLDPDFPLHPVSLPNMDESHFQPLSLQKLRVLSLLSMHSSPLMLALLYSPLPSLHKLTVTPYDDLPFPNTLVGAMIRSHGEGLKSLLLFTPKSWPTRLRPSPPDLLVLAPQLRHLSLEMPLPRLSLEGLKEGAVTTLQSHDLQILSIPRPKSDFWPVLERLLNAKSLPRLAVIRARDVRWVRKGISVMALDTGVQGEMREWKRRLGRRGIRLLDADWRED